MTTKFLTGGALAALAAALAFTAVPASAQDRHDNRGAASRGNWNGGGQAQARQEQRTYQPQAVQQQRTYQPQAVQQQRTYQPQRTTQAIPGWGTGPRATTVERNRTYSDPNRNQTYLDRNRSSTYGDQRQYEQRQYNERQYQQRQYDQRQYQQRQYNQPQYDRSYRNNTQQWNRTWRNDNRYDWQRYRTYNRNVYHLNPYYAPYRSYSYRRLGIGFYLDPLFYGQDYWIGDPGYYRLPDVYGPYRWVRYYDDALLVDVYTGEVVDVIYDFFW